MNGILVVAGNTIWRTVKKPLVPLLFLFVPLLYFVFLKGSTSVTYMSSVPVLPGGTCLDKTFLPQLSGLATGDKECFVFFTMIMLYYGVASFYSFESEVSSGIARRTTASPVGPLQAAGKWLAHLCMSFALAALAISLGAVLFGLRLGENVAQLGGAVFFFCVLAVDVGILLTAVLRNIYLCCLAVFSISFLMMFTAMFSLFAPLKHSAFFSVLSVISLSIYFLNAITGSLHALIVLGAAAAVGSVLALLVGRSVLK